jgi:hypothetical protein
VVKCWCLISSTAVRNITLGPHSTRRLVLKYLDVLCSVRGVRGMRGVRGVRGVRGERGVAAEAKLYLSHLLYIAYVCCFPIYLLRRLGKTAGGERSRMGYAVLASALQVSVRMVAECSWAYLCSLHARCFNLSWGGLSLQQASACCAGGAQRWCIAEESVV